MRVISYSSILDFVRRVPAAVEPLDRWFEIADSAEWKSLDEVRRELPHCDPVIVESGRRVYVFNIGGNKWRLIAAIHFNRNRLYLLRILAHAEYDKNR